jgi:hypothetical protein
MTLAKFLPCRRKVLVLLTFTVHQAICALGELFQLGVEPQWFLQKWRVAHPVVPRGFRGLAVLEYVVGHGRQHYRIRAAVTHEEGNPDLLKERREIKFALSHSPAHARPYDHIKS